MIKEVFRKTLETKEMTSTILVVEGDCGFTSITKQEFKGGCSPKYGYHVNEYYNYSDMDVDIMEALKSHLELSANIPEDFYFDHP